MPRTDYLTLVEDVYLTLDVHFDDIYQAAGDEQRLLLRSLHAAARDAYWRAVAELLEDDSVVVEQIAADLGATTKELKAQLEEMSDVTATLDVAANAVRLAGSLVTLAGA
jgi:hypothetical protein